VITAGSGKKRHKKIPALARIFVRKVRQSQQNNRLNLID
jgi:hypothetical protein